MMDKDKLLAGFNLDGDGYDISAPSLLYSFGVVCQQLGHIDLTSKCFQCALSLCHGKIPSTLIYEGRTIGSEDAALSMDMKGVTTTSMIDYGDLCLPKAELEEGLKSIDKDGWDSLQMTVTRGGIIHAGPASAGYRCVLFFTLVPKNTLYDSNHQVRSWDLPSLVYADLFKQDEANTQNKYLEHIVIQSLKFSMDYIDVPFFRRLLHLTPTRVSLMRDVTLIERHFRQLLLS
jgi:hypothetical protein